MLLGSQTILSDASFLVESMCLCLKFGTFFFADKNICFFCLFSFTVNAYEELSILAIGYVIFSFLEMMGFLCSHGEFYCRGRLTSVSQVCDLCFQKTFYLMLTTIVCKDSTCRMTAC